MNDPIAMLEWLVDAQQGIPTLAEMPRRTLSDKGIAGPTAAHVIEEIHTPLNLALVTFTTGSSAFQNIVGVTQNELLLRSAAGGVCAGGMRRNRWAAYGGDLRAAGECVHASGAG